MELQTFAKIHLSKTFAEQEYQSLYATLCLKSQSFKEISQDLFSMEYLAARLALTSRAWEMSCAENGLKSEEYSKLYFQLIMGLFETPKMKDIAVAYSEYLYAKEDAEQGEMSLAILAKMFERLKLQPKIQRGNASPKMSPVFQILAESFEGYRVHFENEFLEKAFPTAF